MSGPSKAASIVLSPRLSGARAFESVASACLEHADANQPFVDVHGHHEGLHQFRVAYRRLRSLFSLARDVTRTDAEALRIKAGLRQLTVRLGPARDLDVFLEAHTDLTERDRARLESAREWAYADVANFLSSDSWGQLRADLEGWLTGRSYRQLLGTATWSGRRMAAAAIHRRYRRVLFDGHHLAQIDEHARHKVRIEAKKVRYGCQFFGSMWPACAAETHAMEKLLGELQDRLGALNDVVTWTAIERRVGLTDAEPPFVDVDAEIEAAQQIVARLGQVRPFWSSALPRHRLP